MTLNMGVSQHICHCILGLSQVGLNNSDPSLRSLAHYFIGAGAVSQTALLQTQTAKPC